MHYGKNVIGNTLFISNDETIHCERRFVALM